MYRKTILNNKVRVITHDMKERDSVVIGIWVSSGGRYEVDNLKGIAHFLEHILFKGSRKYACEEIKEKIEGVGGSLNAFTTEEQTCYYAKIPSQHIEKTLDILADMVIYPLITKKDVGKERGVILEEIKMYHDLPQYFVLELLDEMMWPNHPLGKNLAGTAETVSRITEKDLKAFHRKHYTAGHIVVAACGKIKHEHIVDLVKKKLADAGDSEKVDFLKAQNSQEAPTAQFFGKATEQMHVALGMMGLDENHQDKYALNLLHIILGGNMSSRLFDVVREKKGLAYSISSYVKSLSDTGMFMVRAGVDNHKIVEAMDVILKELRKIKRSGVRPGEFKRAKEYYAGQVLLGLEDTLDHMLWLGDALMTRDEPRTLQEVIEKVNEVTIADIERVAHDILQEKRFNLAIVGPVEETQKKQLSGLLGM